MDELKAAVSLAEKDVADAAARRNFEAAASAQSALDKAKDRLDEAMRAEGMSPDDEAHGGNCCDNDLFQSRAELEAAIEDISAKIDEAIATKKFNVATKYQSELDELEKLRSTMPSIDELTAQLNELKAEIDKAINAKNFQKADALQKDVDALETKIADERCKVKEASSTPSSKDNLDFIDENGESITFDGRYRLEEEINRFKMLVADAASSKKFKEASKFQDYLDRLEEMRPMLPNLEELTMELATKKNEMDLAIQNKDFKEAEHLHEVIESIEQKLLIEKKNGAPEKTMVTPSSFKPAPSIVKAPTTAVKNARPKALNDRTNTGASVYSKSSQVKISDSRPVSKLRPKAPTIAQEGDTVLAVAQLLTSKRGDAAIITNFTGALSGIVTDSK